MFQAEQTSECCPIPFKVLDRITALGLSSPCRLAAIALNNERDIFWQNQPKQKVTDLVLSFSTD
jgi:hypothetical protein